jgi:hypothetical protein
LLVRRLSSAYIGVPARAVGVATKASEFSQSFLSTPACMNLISACLIAATLVALIACTSRPLQPLEADQAWHDVPLPGKARTQYLAVHHEGRPAMKAVSEGSASMWRRKLSPPTQPVGEVSFSWWVAEKPVNASVADGSREDAAARLLFAFDGDTTALPARTRALFELAEALTGERPPYATLMYVWDATAPVGTVIINPRTDRIRKIVVDSGLTGLGQWRDHRRNLADDFRKAFGESPGPLLSMALMTDSDNTQSTASAWFGEIRLY